MDKTNRKIIDILQSDGRISIAEIAKQVHLSAPAVTERIKRLEEQSIITGYNAKINCNNYGLPVEAMVLVRVFLGKEQDFIKFAKSRPEILEGYNVTGECAFVLKVATESIKKLDTFLEDVSGIGESKTMIILSEVTRKKISQY